MCVSSANDNQLQLYCSLITHLKRLLVLWNFTFCCKSQMPKNSCFIKVYMYLLKSAKNSCMPFRCSLQIYLQSQNKSYEKCNVFNRSLHLSQDHQYETPTRCTCTSKWKMCSFKGVEYVHIVPVTMQEILSPTTQVDDYITLPNSMRDGAWPTRNKDTPPRGHGRISPSLWYCANPGGQFVHYK